MIEVRHLVKRHGAKTVVDDLDFTVEPGTVTGFLGPNGAGKSTTMRMILGLDVPTSGSVTVGGRRYDRHPAPLQEIGALLDARCAHPARSAYHHLLGLALTHGIPRRRVHEVIELTGLEDVARKRAGRFSLGMSQRLGIAAALLGDPATVMLDEPVNGLDPEGVRWIRDLLTGLAAEGRTVFVSSHLMSEMALTASRLVIIGRGRLLADTTVEEVVRAAGTRGTTVASSDPVRLREALAGPGVEVAGEPGGERLHVTGASARRIGETAAHLGVTVYELTTERVSLEDAFMAMTGDCVEYQAAGTRPAAPAGSPA